MAAPFSPDRDDAPRRRFGEARARGDGRPAAPGAGFRNVGFYLLLGALTIGGGAAGSLLLGDGGEIPGLVVGLVLAVLTLGVSEWRLITRRRGGADRVV